MKNILLCVLLSCSWALFGQKAVISGNVQNQQRDVLPGANVLLKGTVRGVQTNAKGDFSIQGLKAGTYTLSISFVGHQSFEQKVQVKEFEHKVLQVVLNESNLLKEVVVNANAGVKGNEFMSELNDYTIAAGKKNELIKLDNLNANLAMNNARQVFSRTPGIQVWESDGSGIQLGVASRGLSPNRSWEFNVRMDGYEITPDPMGYPEAYYSPPMEVVDRIEIIRGASSLQYGPQFGGLMNFVLRKPDPSTKILVESQNTVGNNNLLSSFNYVGGTLGRLSYATYYQKRMGNGWRQNSYFNTDHSHAEISYAVSAKLKIGAQATYMYTQSQQAGGLTEAQFAQNAQQSTRERNWFSNPWFIYAFTAEYVFNEHSKLSWKNFGTIAERSSVGFTKAITEVDLNGNRQVDRDYYQTFGSELRYLLDFKTGTWKNTLATGLRYFSGEIDRKQLGVGTSGKEMDFSISGLYTRDLIFHNINFAAFAETILRPNDKLLFTLGARSEQIETSMAGQSGLSSAGVPIAAVPSTRTRSFFLFGAGMEYKIGKESKLYSNIAQAFRPVLASDLLPPATTDVIDPNLKDASGFNVDLGYRGTIGNYLSFDVDYFYLDYNNRVGVITQKNSLGSTFQYRTNLGHTVSKGFEGYVEWSPSQTFLKNKPWGNLSVFASLAFIDASYKDFKTTMVSNGAIVEGNLAGKKVENAPSKINRYGITYSKKGLSITWQMSEVGETFADASNTILANAAATTGLIPAYQVQDISGSYRFKKTATLKFGVNNLSNSMYFTRRSGGYPGPGILPADGRTWYLGLNLKFIK